MHTTINLYWGQPFKTWIIDIFTLLCTVLRRIKKTGRRIFDFQKGFARETISYTATEPEKSGILSRIIS